MSNKKNFLPLKQTLVILTALSLILLASSTNQQQIFTRSLEFLSEQTNSNFNFNSTASNSNYEKQQKIQNLLTQLYEKIAAAQSQSNKSFSSFPPQPAEIKGLYSSFIHLNFIDVQNSFIANTFRNSFAAPDMNMFVTNFVLCTILEAFPYASETLPAAQRTLLRSQIANALVGISEFRDKNYKEKVPVYNFWRQQLVNGTWSQSPETMLNLIKIAPHFPKFFIDFLKKVKLDNVANFLEVFDFMTQVFMYAFRIPPDADDSSVNIALTGLLYKMQAELNAELDAALDYKILEELNEEKENKNFLENFVNEISQSLGLVFENKLNKKTNNEDLDFNEKVGDWYRNNSDYVSFFNTLKAKAYRPFLNSNFTQLKNKSEASETADLIDPRTYFVIRKFLQQKFSSQEDLILPTTWLHDIKDEQKEYPLVTMPFRVNNIDFNVVTNFLYGTTNLILNHPDKNYIVEAFDAEMLQMYSDTVDLIIFAIKEDIFNWRPDLALLYYPSVFDFYWLISRVYSTLKNSHTEIDSIKLIKSEYNSKQSVFEVLKACELKLENVLKNELTQQMAKRLLQSADGSEFFFNEFLGNTEAYKRNQDSLFATALGLNAFLNIWTKEFSATNLKKIKSESLKNKNLKHKNLIFDKNASSETKTIIENLANYLINNAGKRSASFEGAFFSGSVKSESSNAIYFPGNYYKFLNGTDLADHSKAGSGDFTMSTGVKGFVGEEKYQELLKDDYFGKKPPVDFQPYSMNIFPYWSSPAMTMSVNYLALNKYNALFQ